MSAFPENMNPDLLTSFLSGETNAAETLLVREWIDFSAENKAEFERLQKIWQASEDALPASADMDIDAAWARLNKRIEQAETKPGNSFANIISLPLRSRTAFRIAAVFIPLIVLTFIIISQFSKTKTTTYASFSDTATVVLSDQSLVQLNLNSTLRSPDEFKGKTREVSLSGEAFFTVTPNPQQAFIIHLKQLDIQVVGTSFNVKADSNSTQVEVIVKTGKVLLSALNPAGNKTDSIYLTAGMKGIFNRQTSRFSTSNIADENELYWLSKTLVFNKTSLDSVFNLLEKIYSVSINFKDPEISKLRLTARYEGLPVDKTMEIIGESFGFRIQKADSIFNIDVARP